MSRTYRAAKLPMDCNCGAAIGWTWRNIQPTPEETIREINKARRKGIVPDRCCRCRYDNLKHDYWSKRNHKRDNKPKENSGRTYKKVSNRCRRAKVKDAIRNNKFDNIPIFKRSNDLHRNWDYW